MFDHQARLFGKEDGGASSITNISSNIGQAGVVKLWGKA